MHEANTSTSHNISRSQTVRRASAWRKSNKRKYDATRRHIAANISGTAYNAQWIEEMNTTFKKSRIASGTSTVKRHGNESIESQGHR